MIKGFYKISTRRLVTLLVTIFLILSTLVSCYPLGYRHGSKEEIANAVNNATEISGYTSVYEYLLEWDLPKFKHMKLATIEHIVQDVYCYGDGLPNVLTHAKDTVNLFLEEYFDKIDLGNKQDVTNALLTCYATATGDPYTIFRAPSDSDSYITDMSGEFGGIGTLVEYNHSEKIVFINTVFPDSPAEKAGLKSGDVFYAIDGKTIEELGGYLNATDSIRGEIGTKVNITVIRNGKFVEVTATRALIEEINVNHSIDAQTNVAYVQILQFKDNTYEQFVKAIDDIESKGAEGIVFDLRGNPGGYLHSVIDVISYLIPNGKTILSYKENNSDTVYFVSQNDNANGDHVVDLPFVVICDELTASAGEIFTAAIRDYRNEKLLTATIVGTTTYKKGIMQSTYSYFDGSSITVTSAYYYPPCGINYHGIGITPDVIVENTDPSVDLQLEAAYSEMQKLLNAN